MERRPARYFPPAAEIISSEEDYAAAVDGYRIFFDVFIHDDPTVYITFDSFAYKHFGTASLPTTHYVFARKEQVPVAMQWYLDAPVIYGGQVVPCVHGADTSALPSGRGAHFLGMFSKGERAQRRDGYSFRYGTPNENAMVFSEKFGARVIGSFYSASAEVNKIDARKYDERNSDIAVSAYATNHFTRADYERMNSVASRIAAYRTKEYFTYRVDGLVERSFSYVVARIDDVLAGYLILRWDAERSATIYDWEVLPAAGTRAEEILGSLLIFCTSDVDHFSVSQLNPDSGEVDLLCSLGFELDCDANGVPCEQKFVVCPYLEEYDATFMDFARWRQRLIDQDYALNCLR